VNIMGHSEKVPVTLPALLKRINRKIAAKGERLKATRGERLRGEVGDYYGIDDHRNFVTARHVDPVQWGRELGVLKEWEEIGR